MAPSDEGSTLAKPPFAPPHAQERPEQRTHWGHTVEDRFAWIRGYGDSEHSEEILALLQAENAYTQAVMAPTEPIQTELFDEIKSRVRETDLSVPVVRGPWAYYVRTEEGSQYAIHCRRRADGPSSPAGEHAGISHDRSRDGISAVDAGGIEQILLDENLEAGDRDYFDLGVFEVSVDHNVLAFGVDDTGDERFTIRFVDLRTGDRLDDVIEDVTYGSAFSADGQWLFYVRPDEANRPHQVWRHQIGQSTADDVVVFTEPDERFFVGLGRDKDDRFIQIALSSSMTDEVWLIPADEPETVPQVVTPRRHGVEYSVGHRAGTLVIVTNDGAPNFRVMTTPVTQTGAEHWEELIAERPDATISGFDLMGDYLILFERENAVNQIRVRRWSDAASWVLEQPEAVSTVWAGANVDPDSHHLRYGYASMVTPATIFSMDLDTGQRTVLKQSEVLGGVDLDRYETWRIWVDAPDGTAVPVSLVRRRDLASGPAPCLLYAYGAYEASSDPVFSTLRLSLLDRGFVFAIAHVRGGGELGRRWYLDGKLQAKPNTFTDTIAVADALIEQGLTTPTQLALRGGSAGGLLVGAVINAAPDRFGSVVAQVPFVDNVNTMLDPSLPLTVIEWEEWGNPAEDEAAYWVMHGYSPYEQIEAKPYPAVFATAGISDPRVGYWEPAKWVQRLREMTTSDEPILLWTDLDAGHAGPSGRYDSWRDEAKVMAFLLATVGRAEPGTRSS